MFVTWAAFLSLLIEDTVVALSVTGILKVWIVTSEISDMQVRKRKRGDFSVFILCSSTF